MIVLRMRLPAGLVAPTMSSMPPRTSKVPTSARNHAGKPHPVNGLCPMDERLYSGSSANSFPESGLFLEEPTISPDGRFLFFVQPCANNDERMGCKNVKDHFGRQLLGHFPRSTLATSRTAKTTTSKRINRSTKKRSVSLDVREAARQSLRLRRNRLREESPNRVA